jgi:hypothetical protein
MKVPGFLIHCKDLNLFDTGATILPGETCNCKMMRLRWSLQTILLTKVQRTEGLLCENTTKGPSKEINSMKQCKTVGNLYRCGKHVRCSPNEGFCWFTCCIGSRLDSADSANSWILATGSLHQVRKHLPFSIQQSIHFYTIYVYIYNIILYQSSWVIPSLPPQHISTYFRSSGHQFSCRSSVNLPASAVLSGLGRVPDIKT